ncbi:hypothetical protein P171DRAFT_483056 [Karstenula rhodostoma CBS 690.94]|uniref:Uncharacterized protein n=1 Tax=Karstenula rhodostoma CBS 690.94 TaxID=1392251 RepID=A0A9P4UF09_9PLEO|nr:hypothetical protein P171DRAFT_483056 [Karstenula rhodostoma CBS 690.94]
MNLVVGGTEASVPSRYDALRKGFGKVLEARSTASMPEVQTAAELPDALIGIQNCYQLSTILTAVGAVVESREYTGADQEEHWVKEPEQVDDIVAFINGVFHELERC